MTPGTESRRSAFDRVAELLFTLGIGGGVVYGILMLAQAWRALTAG